ncbi:FHA domain-containing protein [Candidatus Peregrinibacteria bacterium]|nr:FHA domain-containing protein [Candidatus Peregrinibacteria bacterium]
MTFRIRPPERDVHTWERTMEHDGVVRIGRNVMNDIVFHNVSVSRLHCEVRFNGREWLARDCGSRNSTYLNGQRLSQQWTSTRAAQHQ